tara:strand:+ start:2002 stop:2163 length:162 start_codon:yes stop_codon:yes gene_type:complete
MTLPSNTKIIKQEVDSIENAVEDADIRAIHPDKLETFAAHLVNKLKNEHSSQT